MPKEILFDEQKALQKATELFWLKGYNGTSMEELTKATGLNRSSIYNSFGDKHGLFIRCLNYYKDRQLDNLIQSVGKLNSPLKKIEGAFNSAIEALLKDKERKGCLFVNTITELANIEEEILLIMKENREQMEKIFEDWIKEGQRSGEISKSFSSLALAKHLFNSFSGLKIMIQSNSDHKSLKDIANLSLSVLKS